MEIQTKKRLAKEVLFITGFLIGALASYLCYTWFYQKYYNAEAVQMQIDKENLCLKSLRLESDNYEKKYDESCRELRNQGLSIIDNIRYENHFKHSIDSIEYRQRYLETHKEALEDGLVPFLLYIYRALLVLFALYAIRLIIWSFKTLTTN